MTTHLKMRGIEYSYSSLKIKNFFVSVCVVCVRERMCVDEFMTWRTVELREQPQMLVFISCPVLDRDSLFALVYDRLSSPQASGYSHLPVPHHYRKAEVPDVCS